VGNINNPRLDFNTNINVAFVENNVMSVCGLEKSTKLLQCLSKGPKHGDH
jgi:hypothetical protein